MRKSRKKKQSPKRVLALPDLEQSKAAVLNSLTSKSGQQTYTAAGGVGLWTRADSVTCFDDFQIEKKK